MASDKTPVVRYLFFKHWKEESASLDQTLMMADDVIDAIRHCTAMDGKARSTRNPANFIKDLIRKSNASDNWPTELKELKYTAIQVTGKKKVFEFVRYEPEQTEPFPDVYKFRQGVATYSVQSLSMLQETKSLGRRDEAWLTQIAVYLRVVESHFALASPLRDQVADLIHLQMSLKLRLTEIDAIYMARLKTADGSELRAGITCEAKQADERVLENQLVEQTRAAFAQSPFDAVIPIAIRTVPGRGIYVAEFQAVPKTKATEFCRPQLVAEALYELKPSVPGI